MDGNLSSLDKIDGGDGIDTVDLNGNYSVGVSLTSTNFANIEQVNLTDAGFNYRLLVNTGTSLGYIIDGSTLAHTLFVSATGSGSMFVTGGRPCGYTDRRQGSDLLVGGAGADFLTGGGGNYTAVMTPASAAGVTVNLALSNTNDEAATRRRTTYCSRSHPCRCTQRWTLASTSGGPAR